jgi:hypothetical protein
VSHVYRAPASSATAEVREQGSVFLADLHPAADEAEVKAFLQEVQARHRDATHHCWASRLGPEPARERSSDAGDRAARRASRFSAPCARAPVRRSVRRRALVRRHQAGQGAWREPTPRRRALGDRPGGAARTLGDHRPRGGSAYDAVGAIKRLIHAPDVELIEETYHEHARLRLRVWRDRETELRAALAELASRRVVVDPGADGR